MKPYTVICNGYTINLTDKYRCAFKIGERHVVVDHCVDCDINNGQGWRLNDKIQKETGSN